MMSGEEINEDIASFRRARRKLEEQIPAKGENQVQNEKRQDDDERAPGPTPAMLTEEIKVGEVLLMNPDDGKTEPNEFSELLGLKRPNDSILEDGTRGRVIKYEHNPGPESKVQTYFAPDSWQQPEKTKKAVFAIKVGLDKLTHRLPADDKQGEGR